MNLEQLSGDLGLDMDEFRELVAIFLQASFSDLEQIRQGTREGAPIVVAHAAHSIKGAAGNLGFRVLYEAARDLEIRAKGNELEGIAPVITVLEGELANLTSRLQDPLLTPSSRM